MSNIDTSAEDAFGRLSRNTAGRWHKRNIDVEDPVGPFAVQRLTTEFFLPVVHAEFELQPDDRVYAIGSCFARGIEQTLVGRGLDVASAAVEFDKFELSRPGVTTLGFTNKYTTRSIRDSLQWALDPDTPFPFDSIVDLENVSIDPHTNPTLQFVDRSRTLERRAIIQDVTRRVADCRVVFMTLGLVEAWYDETVGVYINMTPTREMLAAYPGRYRFRILGFDENLNNLEAVYDTLTRFGHPNLQLVVTVSPVPLMATFTDRDIVVANTYSKSTLRTAADEFASQHDNVHYFPSYEAAMNTRQENAWEEDGRHIKGKMTQAIMGLFAGTYLRNR